MSCRSQTPEKLPVFPLIIETFAFTSVLQPNAGIKIPGRDSFGQLISKLRAMLRVPGPSSFNAALPYRSDSRAVPALTPVLAGSGASSFKAISDLTPVLLVGTDFARAVAAIPAQCSLFLFTVFFPQNAPRWSSARRTSPKGFGGLLIYLSATILASRSSSAWIHKRTDGRVIDVDINDRIPAAPCYYL